MHYQKGGHGFPDIIIEYIDFDIKYGIEVKASTSSTSAKLWKINGNSVKGSTKDRTVKNIFLLFGKTALIPAEFRIKRYEDAISEVAVTHSPRYLIDMDLAESDTFFERSGISYSNMNDSEDPIGLITEYYRNQDLKAWWISDNTPAALRMYSDLSQKEKSEFIGHGMVYFPEIFSNSAKKFYNLGFWMITKNSILCPSLRDSFTADGKKNVMFNEKLYLQLPQIFNRFKIHMPNVIRGIQCSETESLQETWGVTNIPEDILGRVQLWVSLIKAQTINIIETKAEPQYNTDYSQTYCLK